MQHNSTMHYGKLHLRHINMVSIQEGELTLAYYCIPVCWMSNHIASRSHPPIIYQGGHTFSLYLYLVCSDVPIYLQKKLTLVADSLSLSNFTNLLRLVSLATMSTCRNIESRCVKLPRQYASINNANLLYIFGSS